MRAGADLPVLGLAALLGCAVWGLAECASGDAPGEVLDQGPGTSPGPGQDAGARPAGDSLPRGAVSFFNRTGCPSGWAPFAMGAGRTLVASVGSDPVAVVQGAPLDDGEDRLHDHAIQAALKPGAVSYAGIAGEANHGVAGAGMAQMTVTVGKASSGLPYVQLLVCQKTADADRTQRPAPAGTLMFFSVADCPTGWARTGLPQGRLLVGVPDGGSPGQKFGGSPLSAMEKRTHHHGVQGSIQTTSHGIALAGGGAASGYAKDDKYPYTAPTDEESVGLPYVQLLQCQKQ